MQSQKRISGDRSASPDIDNFLDYVPFLLRSMDAQGHSRRTIGVAAGISKSRVGLILHGDAAKRVQMTMREFQAILHALDADVLEAIISTQLAHELGVTGDARFTTLIAMIGALFRGMPGRAVDAVRKLEGMDGSEIREEWGTILQSTVINEVVHQIGLILQSREKFAQRAQPRA